MLGAGRGSVKVSRPFLDFTLWIIFLSIFIKSQRERERERERLRLTYVIAKA
jgi:hypothetical protein